MQILDYIFLVPISIFILFGVITPGPSFILVAQTSMSQSRISGMAVSVGMGVGAAIFAVVASLGLYLILDIVPWIYSSFKIFGGVCLCFLAGRMWLNRGMETQDVGKIASQEQSLLKMFLVGLLTQVSNPKTAIVFGSAFAGFLPATVPEYSYLMLCSLAFIIDTGWYGVVAYLLSTNKAQRIYTKHGTHIRIVSSALMGLMGTKLLVA